MLRSCVARGAVVSAEFIGILGVGVALDGLVLRLSARIDGRIDAIEQRMARVEGLLAGLDARAEWGQRQEIRATSKKVNIDTGAQKRAVAIELPPNTHQLSVAEQRHVFHVAGPALRRPSTRSSGRLRCSARIPRSKSARRSGGNLGYDSHGGPMALNTSSARYRGSLLQDLLPSKQAGQSLTQTGCVQGRFGGTLAASHTPAIGE